MGYIAVAGVNNWWCDWWHKNGMCSLSVTCWRYVWGQDIIMDMVDNFICQVIRCRIHLFKQKYFNKHRSSVSLWVIHYLSIVKRQNMGPDCPLTWFPLVCLSLTGSFPIMSWLSHTWVPLSLTGSFSIMAWLSDNLRPSVFNSSPPVPHQWIGLLLIQIMAWCLFSTKPLSEPMLECC